MSELNVETFDLDPLSAFLVVMGWISLLALCGIPNIPSFSVQWDDPSTVDDGREPASGYERGYSRPVRREDFSCSGPGDRPPPTPTITDT